MLIKFRRSIFRGTGFAILELQQNPDPRYQKSVLYACTHLTLYHFQDESSREQYLYKALKYFNRDDFFIEKISEALFKTRDLGLTSQLIRILQLFYKDGFQDQIVNILEARLNDYFYHLPKEYCDDYGNARECAESLMEALYELRGIESFFINLEKLNYALNEAYLNDKEDCFCYDFFISMVLNDFKVKKGAELIQKLNITNERVIKILQEYDETKDYYKNQTKNAPQEITKITFEDLLNQYKKRKYISFSWRNKYVKTLTKEDVNHLANRYFVETELNQMVIMSVFTIIDCPFKEKLLLRCFHEASDIYHKNIILEALARFKNPLIRELALHNINHNQYIFESLTLLKKNLIQEDIPLLFNVLRNYKSAQCDYDFHGLVLQIIEIMEENPELDFSLIYPILIDRGRCSKCRYEIVKTLCANKYAYNDIESISMCTEDCDEKTSFLAKNKIMNY